jgi:protein-tyrosine phosphatase
VPAAPYRVCFVCSGNICRSPTAEVVLRRLLADEGLADRVRADSAGIGGWHVGRGADARAVAALRARGYDAQPHRARQFRVADFAERDLVVALDSGHERDLLALAPTAEDRDKIRLLRSYDAAAPSGSGDLDVPDPYYGSEDGFEHVLDLVESACRRLLEEIREDVSERTGRTPDVR